MNDERILPHSPLSENRLLSGAIGSDRVFFNAISKLKPEHFYFDLNHRIFDVMIKEKTHEIVTIATRISDFDFSLCEADCSYTGDPEIEQIIECFLRRTFLSCILKTESALYHDFERKAFDITGKLISDVIAQSDTQNDRPKSFSELLPAQLDHIRSVEDGGEPSFIKTGFIDIDETVSIQQDSYIIVGGSPSMGKSTFSGTIARNVSKSTAGNIVIFSMESSSQNEISRALFTESHLSLNQFNLGFLPKQDFHHLYENAEHLSKLRIFIDDSRPITPARAYAKCQRIIHEFGPLKLVIFDFIQLMEADYKIDDPRERINQCSLSLKRLIPRIGCPIIANSQLSRYAGMTKKPPERHHLRESGSLEQDADTILLLYRPDYFDTDAEQKNTLDVYIAKQRNGAIGSAHLSFIAEQMRIENLAQHEAQTSFIPHFSSDL